MSQHNSLKGSGIKTTRSVLKRYERIQILKKQGKRKETDSVYKLPKTKSI